MLIAIEGNIRALKKKVLKLLQNEFPVEIIDCSLDREQMLKFFKEPTRWAFPLLVHSLIQKYIMSQRAQSKRGKIIITNRSHHSDLDCFAKTFLELRYISSDEYKIFENLYHSFTFPQYDTIIYLRTNMNACFERALESTGIYYKVNYALIKNLHEAYEEYISSNVENVRIIDIEKFTSLEKNEKQRMDLVSMMKDIIAIPKTELNWTEVQYPRRHRHRRSKKLCVNKTSKKIQ